jgi:hypothetical protein
MPTPAHRDVVTACLPLVEHLAYELEVERQEDRVARVQELLRHAGPELSRALERMGAKRAEVQLLDMHGMRAREAREALETCTEPISVVWFGKGTGVLREVFLEFLDRRPDLLLVDMSGETAERPQEAMGLVLRRDFHDALVEALQGRERVVDGRKEPRLEAKREPARPRPERSERPKGERPRAEPARSVPAALTQPPSGLWGFVAGLLTWLFGLLGLGRRR